MAKGEGKADQEKEKREDEEHTIISKIQNHKRQYLLTSTNHKTISWIKNRSTKPTSKKIKSHSTQNQSRRNTLHKRQYETSISRTTRTSTTHKEIPIKSQMTQTSSWNEHRRRFLRWSIENTVSKHYVISRHRHQGYRNENELVMVLTVLINVVKTWEKNRNSESYRIK